MFLQLAFLASSASAASNGRCLPNDVHLDAPKDFGKGGFPARSCPPYEQDACCSLELMQEVSTFNTTRLYNFDWAHCGPISERCEHFLLAEECMYQCSPRVAYWPGETEWAIDRVPICGDFCDNWFDACRDDLTCAKDWLNGFHVDSNGVYSCKEDSPCVTFGDTFADGRELCNSMWADSFQYVEKVETDDSINCLTMWWNASEPSPNEKFTLPDGAGRAADASIRTVVAAVAATVAAAAVTAFGKGAPETG